MRRPRSRARRLAVALSLGVVGLLVAWQLVHGTRAAWSEYQELRPRRAPVEPPPDARSIGLTDVRFTAADGTSIAGWYVPSRNGAAVILAVGTGTDRTALLNRARQLAAGRFGVLLFDWPGYGESGGVVRLGAPELAATRAAVDFVAARPDVRPGRIGILGFSQGTWYATVVAAEDRRIAAVVLEGAFGDEDEQVAAEYSHGGPFSSLGAELGARLGGMRIVPPRPVDVVARIAPRPVVVVAGSSDVTVPPRLSRALYDAAGAPKQYWVIHGAGHGGYALVDPSYATRVRTFFAQSLGVPLRRVPPDSAR